MGTEWVSENNLATLRFTSDHTDNKQGFHIVVYAVKDGEYVYTLRARTSLRHGREVISVLNLISIPEYPQNRREIYLGGKQRLTD